MTWKDNWRGRCRSNAQEIQLGSQQVCVFLVSCEGLHSVVSHALAITSMHRRRLKAWAVQDYSCPCALCPARADLASEVAKSHTPFAAGSKRRVGFRLLRYSLVGRHTPQPLEARKLSVYLLAVKASPSEGSGFIHASPSASVGGVLAKCPQRLVSVAWHLLAVQRTRCMRSSGEVKGLRISEQMFSRSNNKSTRTSMSTSTSPAEYT